jgi:hypothetical protein
MRWISMKIALDVWFPGDWILERLQNVKTKASHDLYHSIAWETVVQYFETEFCREFSEACEGRVWRGRISAVSDILLLPKYCIFDRKTLTDLRDVVRI